MLPKMDIKCVASLCMLLCIVQTICGFSWYKGQSQVSDESILNSLQQFDQHLFGRQRRSSYQSIKNNNLKDKIKYGIHSQKMQRFLLKLQKKKLENEILKSVPTDYNRPARWPRPSAASKHEIKWLGRTPVIAKTNNFKDTLYGSPTIDEVSHYAIPKPTKNVDTQRFSSANADRTNKQDSRIKLSPLSELAFTSVPAGQTQWLILKTTNNNPYTDTNPVDIPNSESFGNFKDKTIPLPVSKSTGSWGDIFSPDELSDLNFGDFNMNSGFNLNDVYGSTDNFPSVPAPPGGFDAEGSFVQDTSGCENIQTKSCTTDTDCSCHGFYLCIKEKCQTISSHQPGLGVWADGPIDIGSFSSGKNLK